MKKLIEFATLEKYNANVSGKNVGDCVKRSISLAYDLSYTEVGKLLNEKMHQLRKTQWNIQPVFEKVIQDLGASSYIKIADEAKTLEEFVDNEALPYNTYLLLVGKKVGSTSHLVCVRNNKIWDSWDSRDRYVDGYWIVDENIQHKEFTDIREKLPQISKEYTYATLFSELEKQMNKYMMEGISEYKGSVKDYTIKTSWTVVLDADEVITKDRHYDFKINITIEPTMTEDEAINHLKTTGKIRMYDRMYAIHEQEKKLQEEYLLRSKLKDSNLKQLDTRFMTDQELRFYKSLPGWAKALVYYIDIQNPGYYSDSYTIKLHKLPEDNAHPDEDKVVMRDYDASGIKYQLDKYKNNLEIEGIDYYRDW